MTDPILVWQQYCDSAQDHVTRLAASRGRIVSFDIYASHALQGRDLALLNNVFAPLAEALFEGPRQRGKSTPGSMTLTLDCVNGSFFGRLSHEGGKASEEALKGAIAAVLALGLEQAALERHDTKGAAMTFAWMKLEEVALPLSDGRESAA